MPARHARSGSPYEDRYGFSEPNEQLSALMKEKGVDHTFRLVDGGGHAWSSASMLPNLEESLKFVATCFQGDEKDSAKPADAKAGGDADK